MPGTLLLIDFPGIKSFVFGTDKAKEIRGGSAILDDVNTNVLRKQVEETYSEGGVGDILIYAGGGKALLELPVQEEGALRFLNSYQERVRLESKGGLALEYAFLLPEERIEQRFGEEVEELHRRLRRRRYGAKKTSPRVHAGTLRSCHSCSTRSASQVDKDGSSVCDVCFQKQKESRANNAWSEFIISYEELAPELSKERLRKHKEKLRPDTFEDIAKTSKRKGYMALVYADGDDMGKIVKKLAGKEDLQRFSHDIDCSLKRATFRALQDCFPPVYVQDVLERLEHKETSKQATSLPVDILLLGGDDLVLMIQADQALPFVLKAAKYFQEETKERFGQATYLDNVSQQSGLSCSFGIAFAKEKQPFSIVLEQAEALLKSAKSKRKKAFEERWQGKKEKKPDVLSGPYIDVLDVSQTRFLELDAIRSQDLTLYDKHQDTQARLLTCWPRSLEEAEGFYQHTMNIVNTGMSKGKILRFADAALKTYSNSVFDTCRYLVRLDKETRHQMFAFFDGYNASEHPPWSQNNTIVERDGVELQAKQTAIVDLATLFRFVPREVTPTQGDER